MCLRARIPDSLRLAKHNFNDAFFLASQRCLFVKVHCSYVSLKWRRFGALEIIIFRFLGLGCTVLNILKHSHLICHNMILKFIELRTGCKLAMTTTTISLIHPGVELTWGMVDFVPSQVFCEKSWYKLSFLQKWSKPFIGRSNMIKKNTFTMFTVTAG